MSDLIDGSVPLARGTTLGEQVTEALRVNVTDGSWPVGAMLPSESSLAQSLQVSRTVIREAVSRLKAEGLLSSQQGRGAFVVSDRPQMGFSIAKQDVESLRKLTQILELRMGLEIEAAALAAERADADAHKEINAAAQAFADSTGSGAEGVESGVAADIRFHRAINDATGNDYYLGLFNYLGASLRETILAGRLKAVERGGESREAVQEHLDVANAILAGDADAARECMRNHLKLSGARLLGNLKGAES
ncbi:FadR/GntR family transcriptional regulator [Neptunicoccus cionae]|uniref:FadR/GntR family transcriptional regulator n=1 Tax=Neptunicoccus cionae TaxID=2035344 RepID=UPI000C75EC89|nr:FadR/GntR family transcriptional regulator [Amylibacter cionae]PLS19850.1 FadR family transcriptional regulator [Amylibacter cionae]